MTTRKTRRSVLLRAAGIALALAVTAAVCVLLVLARAEAQSRYDHDASWVRQSLRETDRRALERHYGEPVEIVRRPRRPRRHAARPAPPPVHPETRVYGVIHRPGQQVLRDATAHVTCWPPVENTSREHSDEGRAWNDAQLGWMASVSVKYGARFADIQNVDARSLRRQCFRSSFDESWLARNREALAQNTGTGLGYKVRCTIIAAPCMAPMTNETPLKGDEKQKIP